MRGRLAALVCVVVVVSGPDDVRVFATLGDLQSNPELLRPPPCIVPRFAYQGRAVAVCGPDKSGKSTLLAHIMAALSYARPFLGESLQELGGRSVLLGLEEAVGDEVRRLTHLHANPARIQILHGSTGPDLLARTCELLDEWPAELVAVDSLTEYARVVYGEVPSNGDDAGWAAVCRPLVVAVARRHGAALVILHHVRRSDGQYRGASEIAASVDAIIEMELGKATEDPTLRRFTGRGRWHIDPFSIVLRDHGYELGAGAELSLDARVLLHVEQSDGLSGTDVAKRVGARKATVLDVLRALEDRGAVEQLGEGPSTKWHAVRAQGELEVAQ